MENLYTLIFTDETGGKMETGVRARNKIEAIEKGFSRLTGWRAKDRVVNIAIKEDAGNQERTAEDYK